MDRIETLKQFPLLSGINDEEIKALADVLNEESFEIGKNIITEGDAGSVMYLLVDGIVDIIKTTIYGDKYICATLNSNMHAIFGEMALIDNDKRSATVLAKTNCKTLSIDTKAFQAYCKNYPHAGVELLRLVGINLARNLRIENENLKMVYQALIEEIESN